MGTGIDGAGPLSLPSPFPREATSAIDLARAAASGRISREPSASTSPGLFLPDRRSFVASEPEPPPEGAPPPFAPLREIPLLNLPLAFATLSLMPRGTKPYLSMPKFVNIPSTLTL